MSATNTVSKISATNAAAPNLSQRLAISLMCATSLFAEQTLAADNDLRIQNKAQLRYAVGGQYFGASSNLTDARAGYVESRVAEQHNTTSSPTFVRTALALPAAPRARLAAQSALRTAAGPIQLNLLKSQEVFDANGDPMLGSGSRILYRLEISGVGAGTATAVIMTDPVPAKTTYIANSLRLNGETLTDADDADGGRIVEGETDLVQVSVGSISEAGGAQIVEFEVLVD